MCADGRRRRRRGVIDDDDDEARTDARVAANARFASACARLERAMRRLATEMTTGETIRQTCATTGDSRRKPRRLGGRAMTCASSVSCPSSDESSPSPIARKEDEDEDDDDDELESVDGDDDDGTTTGTARGERNEGGEERGDVARRRLEMKCARLESTVTTLRRALEDRTRAGSNDAEDDEDDEDDEDAEDERDERDEATRDVLAHEIVNLRRCVKRASMERERLLEMSNDLRAALHRSRAETRESRLKTRAKTPPPTTTTSIPIVEAKPSVRASIAHASIASSTSERETLSQRSKLKSAMRRAKERRAAAAKAATTAPPAVRNWNRCA